MGNMTACTNKASELYTELSLNNNLSEWVDFGGPPTGHYCFGIGGFTHTEFDSVSISVPPDAMGNRGAEYDEGEPSTFETALIKDGELVYVDELGYEDVQRFSSTEELIAELERLHNSISEEEEVEETPEEETG